MEGACCSGPNHGVGVVVSCYGGGIALACQGHLVATERKALLDFWLDKPGPFLGGFDCLPEILLYHHFSWWNHIFLPNCVSLSLPPTQFYIYFGYFTLLAVVYFAAFVYVVVKHGLCRKHQEATPAKELSSPVEDIQSCHRNAEPASSEAWTLVVRTSWRLPAHSQLRHWLRKTPACFLKL